MLDYVFFDEASCAAFIAFLGERHIEYSRSEEDGVFEVSIPEGSDDEDGSIEQRYDALLEAASATDADDDGVNLAGLTVTLSDGRVSYAVLPAGLVRKLADALSNAEIQEVVSAIAAAAENPDERSLCQRVREGEFT
jgi:hypothetical protein